MTHHVIHLKYGPHPELLSGYAYFYTLRLGESEGVGGSFVISNKEVEESTKEDLLKLFGYKLDLLCKALTEHR